MNPAASESEASASQAPGEPEEAGEGGSGVQGPVEGGGRSLGNLGRESRDWDSLGDAKTLSLESPHSPAFTAPRFLFSPARAFK